MFRDKISIFKTFNSEPKTITLGRWINATMKAGNKFAKQVQQYRETGEDHLKKGLPFITAAAICEGGRKLEDVKQRTGWIALDIDAKDNPGMDAEELRDALSKIVYVAYAGLSVSGKGVWALVKVEDPEKQEKYFQQLQHDFNHFGIVLDSSKGRNPNDPRFYSFDPDAYLTDDFKVYDRLPKEPTYNDYKSTREPSHTFDNNYSLDDTRDKVESLITKIQRQRIDITGNYHTWRDLGFALEDEFGESGRDYFHAISEFYPGYSRRETDRQYSHCLKHRGSGITVGTFMHQCREYGITLSHAPQRDNALGGECEGDDPAPYGYNPYTGEIFDERGYPSDWDNINEGFEPKPQNKIAVA